MKFRIARTVEVREYYEIEAKSDKAAQKIVDSINSGKVDPDSVGEVCRVNPLDGTDFELTGWSES